MGLDSVEILVRVEKYFDISISDREAEKIITVQDFADCVFKKVTHMTSKKLFDKSEIEKAIVGIISDSTGIPIKDIKLTHRIHNDLGVD